MTKSECLKLRYALLSMIQHHKIIGNYILFDPKFISSIIKVQQMLDFYQIIAIVLISNGNNIVVDPNML